MVALNYFGFSRGHVGLKKSVTLIPIVNRFFRHVTSFPSGRATPFVRAAAGLLWVWFRPSLLDSLLFVRTATVLRFHDSFRRHIVETVAVFFLSFSRLRGSRKSFQQLHHVIVDLSGCRPFVHRASGYSCVLSRGPRGPQPVL